MDTIAEPDADEFPRTDCGCGLPLVFTPDGWQHDCAPYFWGNDHEPDPDDDAKIAALRYIVDHCEHTRADDLPEPGDRCKDCGIGLVWVGPGMNDWEPAVGEISWQKPARAPFEVVGEATAYALYADGDLIAEVNEDPPTGLNETTAHDDPLDNGWR